MTDLERWFRDASRHGWTMPTAPEWKRLPVVRHIRAVAAKIAIERWYASGPGSIGAFRSGYDDWVVYGIWYGLERPE
jgi:hypothetical protein